MIIMVILELLIWGSIAGLILYVAARMWRKAAVKERVNHLKLVDENYEEVLKAKNEFKDSEQKEEEIKKFTKQS